MDKTIEEKLQHIFALLAEAKFIEAMNLYLHENVTLQEANEAPKSGKEFCINFEQDFIDNQLAEFIRYEVGNHAVNGSHSYYDAIMELKLKDGTTMKSEQVVSTEWKDGKIFKERYYHA